MDAADIAQQEIEVFTEANKPKPYELPAGVRGWCPCDRYSPRLIGGLCGACRDPIERRQAALRVTA
jgi:hypothetical protein